MHGGPESIDLYNYKAQTPISLKGKLKERLANSLSF